VSILLLEYMEEKYKEALRHIKTGKENPHRLFSTPWVYRSFAKPEALVELSKTTTKQNLAETEIPAPVITEPANSESTEKEKLLQGLKEFGENLMDTSKSGEVSFDGGKMSTKSADEHQLEVKSHKNIEELNSSIKDKLGKHIFNLRFADKQIKSDTQTKVLFVTDAYINESAIEDSPGISELSCFFHKEVAELFSRMIGAMGLVGDEFFVTSITAPGGEQEEVRDALGTEIFHLKPKFIVTLGALATGHLLANDQRLKNIHGQLFDFKISDQNENVVAAKLMPLFSPKLLHTAPNMKKTAWRDMQKLIELL
jgi:uracil-DNA glycosylase family 4